MSKPQFVYVTYIWSTPEEIWRGLTEKEFTQLYWMHENVSDWKVGSPWTHEQLNAERTVDIVGEVLESDPPRKLVLSWAQPKEAGKPGKTSRVSFELEPVDWPHGPWTQLRIAHTDLEPGSEMLESVSFGWPAVLSGLKTLLETRVAQKA